MKRLYILLIAALWFSRCGKEDKLSPSDYDKNFYVVEDSDNPLDHLIFTVYEKYGLPIFYNDTVCVQERGLDAFGNPYRYYEVLNCNYNILSSVPEVTYSLSSDRKAIATMVAIVKDGVLNRLDKKMYPRSFLIVDSLYLASYKSGGSRKYEGNVFRGMMTSVIGRAHDIIEAGDSVHRRMTAEIIASEIAYYMMKKCREDLKTFFNISESEIKEGVNYYGREIKKGDAPVCPPPETFGFLSFDRSESHKTGQYYKLPDKHSDLFDYTTAIYQGNTEEFLAKCQNHPYVKKKYETLKTILTNLEINYGN